MRTLAIVLALTALTASSGCMTLHAEIPGELAFQLARDDGHEVAALCSHEGLRFSEGARVCMAPARMRCDENGRWTREDDC